MVGKISAITLLALLSPPVIAQATRLADDLQRFLAWFEGEYDNHEQVWRQKLDGAEPLEHVHHIFKAVEYPPLGPHVFFVKQYSDGDYDKVYRQRLYSFSMDEAENAILLRVHSFEDEAAYRLADQDPSLLRNLREERLKTIPGCEVYWRWNGERFDGGTKRDACSFMSKRYGKRIYVNDTLRLSDSWLWIQDQAHDGDGRRVFGHAIPHKNRKVKFYRGWMSVKRHKLRGDDAPEAATEADSDDWLFAKIPRIHNEGQRVPLRDEDGGSTGYTLSLETLTYQETGVPVLKVGVIEDRSGRTLSYSWTEPAARRIGINVRWFQAGLTRIDD